MMWTVLSGRSNKIHLPHNQSWQG